MVYLFRTSLQVEHPVNLWAIHRTKVFHRLARTLPTIPHLPSPNKLQIKPARYITCCYIGSLKCIVQIRRLPHTTERWLKLFCCFFVNPWSQFSLQPIHPPASPTHPSHPMPLHAHLRSSLTLLSAAHHQVGLLSRTTSLWNSITL